MRSQIKLGRIAGIQIGLHYSWFIIALLIAFSLSAHFHSVRPDWSSQLTWAAAIVTAVCFFISLLLHELAHSIVAKSRGLKVRAITLFALGGVSQIESEAPDAKSEFFIAIVGPLTSVVLGIIFLGLARVLGWIPGGAPPSIVDAVLVWLGYINITLAVFNLIPGYPLDGGRVLRSIIWWINKNMERATRAASVVGQVVAFLFIIFGLYRFFVVENFGGLWLAFIGWFLLDASRSSYLQAEVMASLRGHRVADIMDRGCTPVEGYISVRDFIGEYLLRSPSQCFVVMQDHHVLGIVNASDARAVSRANWDQTSVQSIMRPISRMRSVPPDMPAIKALELMARENLGELAVVTNGDLQGIFSRAQVGRYLHLYSGLGKDEHDRAA